MGGRASFRHISESDYSNLLQALSATTKGRSFLSEYRRRSRPQDMLQLLDSLRRIEATMKSVRDQLQPERIADELSRVAMTLGFATEGVKADPEGDGTARRFAFVEQARAELGALATSLGAKVAPDPAKACANAMPIWLMDDERAFFEELGLAGQDSPVER